jgi:HAD superfamily hydrolase (TIGR01509 family)
MHTALVIFDCDGVLVDSEPLAAQALCQALTGEGLAYTREEVDEKFRGRSLFDIVTEIEGVRGEPLPDAFLKDLEEITYGAFRASLKPVRGAIATVDKIQGDGLLTCVASSGTHQKMRFTLGLTGLLQRFEGHLFSATQVPRGKPAPDLFLFAMEKMETRPEACVVVEDSIPGILGALASGARVLAYVAPEHPSRETHQANLRALGVPTFASMSELPDLVTR